jgi:exopolysaccharide biosynthesis polyprenyl glycosylphosphotransferase
MISDRSKGIQNLVLVAQCVLVSAAFWLWLPLCWDAPITREIVNRFLIYNLFVLLGLIVGSRTLRTDMGLRVPGFEETTRRSFRQLGGTLFYFLLYLVAARETQMSRLFFFSFVPLLFIVLFATNRYLPRFIGDLTFRKGMEQIVVLLGPRRKALQIHQWLDQNRHLGLKVLGLLTDDEPNGSDDGLATLGKPADLEKVLSAPGITKVIMAEFPRGNGSMKHYTEICEASASRLLVVADLDRIFGHPVALFEDGGMFFIGLREEPLEDPLNRYLKRLLDILVGGLVVCFILPICAAVVWFLQRVQSPGPLFYRQVRPGFQTRPFSIYKFRTLHPNNAEVDKLPDKGDPRVYPAGRFLRKFSIDEIPQFINVLIGDMSVVGPRPHLMSDNERFPRLYNKAYVRALVKPGITGLAQARGHRGIARTPEDIACRMESDIEYLENWSLALDVWLILRTATQMIVPPKGAV